MKGDMLRPRISPLMLVLILVVGCLTVGPVLMLILGSFSRGIGAFGAFTVEKYIRVYTDPTLHKTLLNTVIFTAGSSLFATALALILAYLNVRTDIPLKGLFHLISIIPMMIPHIVFATSWALLLNPSNGILNLFLREVLGLKKSLFNIYTLGGMIMVEGLLDFPIAYLIIAPAMASFDAALEEAAWVSGGSKFRALQRITLPILRPAILASLALVVVRSLAAFAVPSVIGMPGRVYVLTTYIYRLISLGFMPDYGRAAAAGVSVLVTSTVLVYVYRRLTARSERYVTISARGYKPAIIGLGRWRYPLSLLTSFLFLILIVIPVLVLLYVSLIPYVMPPSAKAFSMVTLKHWNYVLRDPLSLRALKNSVFLALVGASLGILLSTFVSYIIVREKTVGSALLENLAFFSYSFPGLVIGIGFMWFFVHTPLYATIWALLIGYIATYLPYGIRPLTSAFIQISEDLEEASKVAGAGFLYTFRRVVVPLATPGIVSGWILMASMFLRELSLSAVLSRPGTEVLAVQILHFADDSLWGQVSALGILMIALSTIMATLATLVGRKTAKARRTG